MLLTNNYVYLTNTYFIYYIIVTILFLILLNYKRSNNASFSSKKFDYNINGINPNNPEIDPDDSKNDILKKIKKHLNKYKVEYIIGGSVFFFIIYLCYYYNISLEDVINYLMGNDPSTSESDVEGSEGSASEGQAFEDMDIDGTLNILDKQMTESFTPYNLFDDEMTEENELVRLRPDLEDESSSFNSEDERYKGMTMEDFENMDIDEALNILDFEIAEENELIRLKSKMLSDLDNAVAEEVDVAMAREAAMGEENELARLRAELEEILMEKAREEANASMKHITDQLWGKNKGPFI